MQQRSQMSLEEQQMTPGMDATHVEDGSVPARG